MADAESNIRLGIDTSDALASLKALQRQISLFQRQMQQSSAANADSARKMQRSLIDDINATGKFNASIKNIRSTSESFTNALEKNKLSMGEYFRYAGGATKKFGRLFKSEFDTINKVARERVKDLQTQYIALGRDASGALKGIAVRPMSLDMQNLGTQTAIAAQRQQLFNQLLKQGSTNLLNFGKNTQWAGRQLMVGFTIPLSIFGGMASKTFMQLEQQAIRFRRVYGDAMTTAAQTEEALDSIRELATGFTKYGVEIEKTLELAADAAQMGLQGAALREQVANATRLAVLGEVEQQEALKTSVAITNTFGTATADLANKINFLNIVENETMTAISDLTIAIPKAGPVVKQLGGDVEDLAFFLTAMKEGGINASEGANALKSGLASIINPTQQSIDLLKMFNINIEQIRDMNRGDIKGLIIELGQALDTLEPTQRAQAIEQLFGKFQFARVSTLFKNVIQEGTQAQRVLELTNATNQELAALSNRELRRVEQSTTFRFKSAVEQFQAAIAPIGEEFLKLVTPLIEFGTKVANAFNNLSDNAKTFVTGLTVLLGAVGPIALMTFGLLANGVANIIKGFAAVQGIFLRTGKQSNVLGEQIDYMTQEQLNAAAVASSLDQTHSKLIQTLTAEAAVVRRLGDIYVGAWKKQQKFDTGRRIAKQTNFNPGTLNLASGIVSVPGPKGAGDIVPAMLSPGEAVIPADKVQKYAPLIAGMVRDNIPGFERSNVTVSGGNVSFGGATFASASDKQAVELARTVDKLIEAARILGLSAEEAEQAVVALARQAEAEAKDKKVTSSSLRSQDEKYFGGALGLVGNRTVGVREALEKDRLVMGNEGMTLSHGGTPVPLSRSQREQLAAQMPAGANRDRVLNMKKSLNAYSEEVYPTPAILNAKGGILTKGQAADIIRQNPAGLAADAAEAYGLDPNSPAFKQFGENVANELAADADAAFSDMDLTPAVNRAIDKMEAGLEKEALQKRKKTYSTLGGGKGEKRFSAGRGVGLDLGEGRSFVGGPSYLDRRDKKSADARLAAHKSADPAVIALGRKRVQEAEAQGKAEGTAAGRAFAKARAKILKKKDAYPETRDRRSPHRLASKDGKDDGKAYSNARNKELSKEDGGSTRGRGGRIASGVGKVTANLSSLSFALSSLAGAAMFVEGPIGEFANKIFGVVSGMTALIMVTELLTKAKMGELLSSRMKAGKIGFRAANAAGLGPIAKVGMAISRFLGPIGLVTAGLAALGGVIYFLVKANEDQKRAMNELGQTAYLTADKMRKAGELLGVELTTNRFSASLGQGTAAASSGQQEDAIAKLKENDQFKKDFDAEIKALKGATQAEAQQIINSIALGLAASGADAAAVDTFVKALAQVAGQTKLSLNFGEIDIVDAAKNQVADVATQISRLIGEGLGSENQRLLNLQLGTQAAAMQSLKDGLANGLINAEQFYDGMDAVMGVFDELTDAELAMAMPRLAKLMGLEEAFEGIKSVRDQLLLLRADAEGIDTAQAEAAFSADPNDIDNVKAIYYWRNKLAEAIGTQAANQEESNEATEAEKILNAEIQNANISLQERTAALQNQTAAYAILIEQGFSAEEAFELAGDAALAAGIKAAFGAGIASEEWEETIGNIQAFLAAQAAAPTNSSTGAGQKSSYQQAVESLQEQRKELSNTINAYNKLRSAGFGVAEAMKLAEDSTFAAGMASQKIGTAGFNKLVNLAKELNKELRSEAIRKLLLEGKQTQENLLDKISVSGGLERLGYTYEQIQNVLANDDLTGALAEDLEDGAINSQDLLWALKQIENIDELNVKLNLTTREGAEQEFDKLYNQANEYLSAQRQGIELKFKFDTQADNDIITAASNRIAELNYALDDYEADLTRLEDEEQKINESYDARIKALDEVEKANSRIASQQKAQLTLADALSQGDIAAAAKAAQDMRAENAAAALESQRTVLDESRQRQLDALTTSSGRTRKQIEEDILDIKKEIFNIEEELLEPAQERIRLAAVEKDAQLASLEAQIDKWEELRNKIQLAKLTPEQEDALYKQAQTIADMLQNWQDIEDKTATLTIVKKTTGGSSTGPSSGGNGEDPTPSKNLGGNPPKNLTQSVVGGLGGLVSPGPVIAGMTAAEKEMTAPIVASKVPNIKAGNLVIAGLTPAETQKIIATKVTAKPSGGGLKFRAMASGGRVIGTDTVPTMLSPGEFVVSRYGVDNFGTDKLKAINSGTYNDGSVYNYSVNVNVDTDANPDQIAKTVIRQIKQIDSQRLRSNRL